MYVDMISDMAIYWSGPDLQYMCIWHVNFSPWVMKSFLTGMSRDSISKVFKKEFFMNNYNMYKDYNKYMKMCIILQNCVKIWYFNERAWH